MERTKTAPNVSARLWNGFARRAGYELVAEFSDDAVKGSDPVDVRPGFAAMLARIASNGVRTVLETASRFARDLIVQETGFGYLRDAGITLITADSPDSFLDDTRTAVLIHQVLGAVSQFEKAALVAKLRGARDRKKREIDRRMHSPAPLKTGGKETWWVPLAEHRQRVLVERRGSDAN